MSDNHEIVFQAIDRLITAAVPERRAHLNALWQRYAPQFVLSQDQLGFVMKSAAFGAVIYTNKTLLQIWLLGFAAWRAVEAYADIIRSCAAAGLLFDPPSVAALPGQSAVDAAFDRTLAAARPHMTSYVSQRPTFSSTSSSTSRLPLTKMHRPIWWPKR